MKFAENLKRIREEKNLTQQQLADKANVSRPMITQIERGTKSPTVLLAQALATALEVSIHDLI